MNAKKRQNKVTLPPTEHEAKINPIEVMVVEDVEPMLELMRIALEKIPRLKVVAVAKNGWEARLEMGRNKPELVLLDEILPGESSTDLLRDMHQNGIAVICLTSLEAPTHEIPPHALGRIIKPGWKTLDSDTKRLESDIFKLYKRNTG